MIDKIKQRSGFRFYLLLKSFYTDLEYRFFFCGSLMIIFESLKALLRVMTCWRPERLVVDWSEVRGRFR